MSYYGGTITVAGRNLITSLMAGETIEFTRVMVGSGKMPEGVEPIDMSDLVNPVTEAVATIPVVEGGILSMTVEYRNDLNGGLQEGFWLNEFGIYAKTDETEEVLLYYATLGDSPQPVNAYQDNRIDIRRYPVTIALALDAEVEVTYNPGSFMTSAEAIALIETKVPEEVAKAVGNIGSAYILDITIPKTGWAREESDGQEVVGIDDYRYYLDVSVSEATSEQFPSVALHKSSLDVAKRANLCPTVMTLDGAIRFWAKSAPTSEMTATVALLTKGGGSGSVSGGGDGSSYVLPVATATTLGGIKIGNGLSVETDGTVSVSQVVTEEDKTTEEDTEAMLDEIFSET